MMKVDFGQSESMALDESTIIVTSTSSKTADASPIVLNVTERVKTKFVPKLIENINDPQKSVAGKLVYEKKSQSDNQFPTEKITRQSVKVGEFMEISLDTTETFALFDGLRKLYKLYEDMGTIPYGEATFTRIDSSFRQFLAIIQNDPSAARMIGNKSNFELVKLLLQMITQAESTDSLKNSLKELQTPNISHLSNSLNLERLERMLRLMEENISNDNEEFWQHTVFNDNQWIISQLFSCPCTIFEDKAYMGGKSLGNRGGNICDFICQNSLTQNVALVEIKTPCTEIMGPAYRGTYGFSSEMSGAINQVLNYRDKLTKDYYSLCHNSNSCFEVFSPKCLVLIGKISALNRQQIGALENYRNNLNNVLIITYDEMIQRIKDIINAFSADTDYDLDDELPF